jgi:hypothetical protein
MDWINQPWRPAAHRVGPSDPHPSPQEGRKHVPWKHASAAAFSFSIAGARSFPVGRFDPSIQRHPFRATPNLFPNRSLAESNGVAGRLAWLLRWLDSRRSANGCQATKKHGTDSVRFAAYGSLAHVDVPFAARSPNDPTPFEARYSSSLSLWTGSRARETLGATLFCRP